MNQTRAFGEYAMVGAAALIALGCFGRFVARRTPATSFGSRHALYYGSAVLICGLLLLLAGLVCLVVA